jgi:succinyl-CoA synthetase beta subunit
VYLLEHDAKTLLALHGAPVPRGVLVASADVARTELPPAPWAVKAQIAAGGRGNAGLIRTARTMRELTSQLRDMFGANHRGTTVKACRVESLVSGAAETYLSFTLEPVTAGVRVIVSAQGGVDIESHAENAGAIRSATAANRRCSPRTMLRTLPPR